MNLIGSLQCTDKWTTNAVKNVISHMSEFLNMIESMQHCASNAGSYQISRQWVMWGPSEDWNEMPSSDSLFQLEYLF